MKTFEELDAHVAAHAPAVAPKDDVTSPDFWQRLAKLHKTVGPIVRALASFPFIPLAWRTMLSDLVNMMDVLTGQTPLIASMIARGKSTMATDAALTFQRESSYPPGHLPQMLSRDA